MAESWLKMFEIGLVGIAAGLGTVTRYWFNRWQEKLRHNKIPWGTYAVNIIGSFMIGWAFGQHLYGPNFKIFAISFCGGLTTFSTFNFELFDYLDHRDYLHFAEYFLLSYGLGFIAVILGLLLATKG